jgi:hypothetical protein
VCGLVSFDFAICHKSLAAIIAPVRTLASMASFVYLTRSLVLAFLTIWGENNRKVVSVGEPFTAR